MSVSNITSSSQSNFNHSSQQQPQLPLSEPPTEDEYVVVKFDYDHKPKEGRKGQPYTIKKGEKLRLIERTNAEWWKVKSKDAKKAIYVPATYVEICSQSEAQSPEPDLDTYANTEFMQALPSQEPATSSVAAKEDLQQYANTELFKNPPPPPSYSAPATAIGLSRSRPQQPSSDFDAAVTTMALSSGSSTPQPQPQAQSQTSLLNQARVHNAANAAVAAAASFAQANSSDRAPDTGAHTSSRLGAGVAGVPVTSTLAAQPVWKGSKEMLDDDAPAAAPIQAPSASTQIFIASAAQPTAKNSNSTTALNLNRSLPRYVQPPQFEQQSVPTSAAGTTSSLSKATGAQIATASDSSLSDMNMSSTLSASSTRTDNFSTTLSQQSTSFMQTATATIAAATAKPTSTEVPVDIPVEPTQPVHRVHQEGFLSITPLKPDNKLSKSKSVVGYASVRSGRCFIYKDEKAAFLAKNAAASGVQPSSKSKVPPPELVLELRDAQLDWNPDLSLSKRNYFIFGNPGFHADKRFLIQIPEGLKSSGPRNTIATDDLRNWFDTFQHSKREQSDGGAAMQGSKKLSGSRDDLASGGSTRATGRDIPGAAVVNAGGVCTAPVLRHDSASAANSAMARVRRDERASSVVPAAASTGSGSGQTRPSIAAGASAAAASSALAASDKKGKMSKKEEEKSRKDQDKERKDQEKEKGSIFDRLTKFFAKRPTPMDMEKRGLIHDMVFGSTLVKVCENDGTRVPIFVTSCIAEVERRGLDIDGVYRISANLSQVQKLRHIVDQAAGKYNLAEWDVHVITGAMKLFFRELKDPVIDPHTLEKIYSVLVSHQVPHTEKALKMRSELCSLNSCHFETLRALVLHCRKVSELHDKNRMLASNLAIVFGPTLAAPIQSGSRSSNTGPLAASSAAGGGSVKGPQKKRLPAGATGGPVQIGGPLPGPAPEQQQGDPFVSSAMYLGVIFEFLVVNSDAVFGSSL